MDKRLKSLMCSAQACFVSQNEMTCSDGWKTDSKTRNASALQAETRSQPLASAISRLSKTKAKRATSTSMLICVDLRKIRGASSQSRRCKTWMAKRLTIYLAQRSCLHSIGSVAVMVKATMTNIRSNSNDKIKSCLGCRLLEVTALTQLLGTRSRWQMRPT